LLKGGLKSVAMVICTCCEQVGWPHCKANRHCKRPLNGANGTLKSKVVCADRSTRTLGTVLLDIIVGTLLVLDEGWMERLVSKSYL